MACKKKHKKANGGLIDPTEFAKQVLAYGGTKDGPIDGIMNVLDAPQKSLMYLLTGKYDSPANLYAQHMEKLQNNYPEMNIVGTQEGEPQSKTKKDSKWEATQKDKIFMTSANLLLDPLNLIPGAGMDKTLIKQGAGMLGLLNEAKDLGQTTQNIDSIIEPWKKSKGGMVKYPNGGETNPDGSLTEYGLGMDSFQGNKFTPPEEKGLDLKSVLPANVQQPVQTANGKYIQLLANDTTQKPRNENKSTSQKPKLNLSRKELNENAQLQKKLFELGYLKASGNMKHNEWDGIVGSRTQEGIKKYVIDEIDKGLSMEEAESKLRDMGYKGNVGKLLGVSYKNPETTFNKQETTSKENVFDWKQDYYLGNYHEDKKPSVPDNSKSRQELLELLNKGNNWYNRKGLEKDALSNLISNPNSDYYLNFK